MSSRLQSEKSNFKNMTKTIILGLLFLSNVLSSLAHPAVEFSPDWDQYLIDKKSGDASHALPYWGDTAQDWNWRNKRFSSMMDPDFFDITDFDIFPNLMYQF